MFDEETLTRFWDKVNKEEDCWIWVAAKFNRGYGAFQYKGKALKAHRVSYQLAYGDFDQSLVVCHSCDNPSCVNPAHLWLGTPKDNVRDRDEKGRTRSATGEGHWTRKYPGMLKSRLSDNHAKGENNPRATVTWDTVRLIRKGYAEGTSIADLGRAFDMPHSTVSSIVHNRSWKEE